jgi:hypothetical protein
MLNPVAMAIVATTFPDPAERARAIGVFGSMTGLSLALDPILGGALVDGFGWHSIFWVILGLLAAAVLGVLGILGYEPRRVDPLLELRLFRSVPFSSAILMALFALCGFGAGHPAAGRARDLSAVRRFPGHRHPPITSTAVSGMPRSMAGVATSLASAGRQTGTTLGVAISGAIVGSALARGPTAFTSAARGVWWMVLGLGLGILVLGLLSTGRWALDTAGRAAALFEAVDRGAVTNVPPS